MAEHTPGPWIAEADDFAKQYGYAATIKTEDGKIVGVVTPGGYGNAAADSLEEALANAGLFADAPEMLATLQRVQSMLSNMTTEAFSNGADRAIRERVDAVVTKAAPESG